VYQVGAPAVNDAQHRVVPYSDSSDSRSNAGALGSYPPPTADLEVFERDDPISPANIDDTIAATDLHSTSEALSLLSHAAQLQAYGPPGHPYERAPSMSPLQRRRSVMENGNNGPLRYPLVDQGLLTGAQVSQLVAR
jgi:hypothetical protein